MPVACKDKVAAAGCRDTPITVAFVIHTFDIGGIERSISRLVNNLEPEMFRVLIVCLARSGRAAQWINRSGVEIVEMHKRPRHDPLIFGRLARLLNENRADIVHSHNWGTLVETTVARRWSGILSEELCLAICGYTAQSGG